MVDRAAETRELVRRIAREHLEAEAPESVEEFDVVFEPVYDELTEPWPDIDEGDEDVHERGLPIDFSLLDGGTLSTVVLITAYLVRELRSYRFRRELSEGQRQVAEGQQQVAEAQREAAEVQREALEHLSQVEELLKEKTGEGEQVEKILSRVERTLAQKTAGGPSKVVVETSGAADVQLIVRHTMESGLLTLDYTLHSAARGVFSAEQKVRLDPHHYFRDLLQEIETFSLESKAGRRRAQARLGAWGVNLFKNLLPEPLRDRLYKIRESGQNQNLHIVSDAPWIPWELLCFNGRPGDGHEPGPYWAEAFVVTRSLDGIEPVEILPLRQMAVVRTRDSNLPKSEEEERLLLSLDGKNRSVKRVPARYNPIADGFASGEHDAWHFISHAEARGKAADRWTLKLEGQDDLTPVDLQGRASRLGRTKPLVFLNACQTAQGGLSLTGVGGWAAGFLGAGAGAFLGPLWSIRDSRAKLFAETFYRHFLGGETLGEAVQAARRKLRDCFPGDPSWLAYVVFGAAGARVEKISTRKEPEAVGPSLSKPAPVVVVPTQPEPAPSPEPGAEKERLHDKDGSILLYVPGGIYTLGAEDLGDSSRPVHRVRLSPFWIAKHPVTNEQYARFLEQNPDHPEPAFWSDDSFNQPRQPVVGVSRKDAEAYCQWAGLQLPSEAQWEAAARGPEARRYPWGLEPPNAELCNFGGKAEKTTPVDAHPSGRGPFGTLDQAGNVWEWCADSWSLSVYKERVEGERDPLVPGDASYCAVRGGSWLNPAKDLRAACREAATSSLRLTHQGFRCALRSGESE